MTTVQSSSQVSQNLLDAVNGQKAGPKDKTVEAQDRFLKLLVTQMKNQDPLNPMDNAQVTSQMAQLSTVSGIEKMNSSLQGLMGSYQSSQSVQATSMIGRSVLVPGKDVTLEKGKAMMGVELTEPADNVRVTVFNAAGKAVHQVDLGPKDVGIAALDWDGVSDSGANSPDGHYTFKVEATRGNAKVAGVSTLSFGEVGSVSTSAKDGVKLNVMNVGPVTLADVRQII